MKILSTRHPFPVDPKTFDAACAKAAKAIGEFSNAVALAEKDARNRYWSARCVCGLTRRQHETGWPACRGFVQDGNIPTTPH